jgi:demethylmenaquinone methyltransferase/2-methoxy-6-polyprenyl-1,4-benzoquinol methylase
VAQSIYDPEYVKNLFNRMSSSYERMNYIFSFGFSLRWRRQLLQHIKPTARQPLILDLMTGMGEMWYSLSHRFPQARLHGLDFSSGMLQHAQTKNKRHYNNSVTLFQQDVLANQLPSGTFDAVVCAYGLKTFDESQIRIIARETKRVLRSGGQFSFVEVSVPNNAPLRLAYRFYIGIVTPVLGRLLMGDPVEYRMLWQYTSRFVNARRAADIFAEEGLHTAYHSYFAGCASGFSGSKS